MLRRDPSIVVPLIINTIIIPILNDNTVFIINGCTYLRSKIFSEFLFIRIAQQNWVVLYMNIVTISRKWRTLSKSQRGKMQYFIFCFSRCHDLIIKIYNEKNFGKMNTYRTYLNCLYIKLCN